MSANQSKSFWASPLGRRVLAVERQALTSQVRRLHGSVALWAGETPVPVELLNSCMVRQGVYLSQSESKNSAACRIDMPSVNGSLDALPFANHQFDGLVLHHALERLKDPRAGLREAARVLAPGGRIIIVGFNPISLFGVRRSYAKWVADDLSERQFINPIRLFDWLELLGFSLDAKPSYVDYGLPMGVTNGRLQQWSARLSGWQSLQRLQGWFKQLPLGGVLTVTAVKRALPMTLTPLSRGARGRLAPAGYPKVVNLRAVKKDKI
jgi:SAM-dependent methyltransferase